MTHSPNVGLVAWFRQEFLQRTGIWVRDKDLPSLTQTLEGRARACRFASPDAYQHFLANNDAAAVQEWTLLTETLKNGESFFFRDQAQIDLLKNTILPELIERNSSQRSLRVWSAGCSTGEEPYSLAVLLYELLPTPESWNLLILGTDLSENAVAKARRGLYSSWSFRLVDPLIRQRYFREERDGYQIDPRIRKSVTIRQGNLLHDVFPSAVSGIRDLDLILCRNVFIYFDAPSIAKVIHKFSQSLAPMGYLMTGHGELHQLEMGDLRTVRFPESVVYQREQNGAKSLAQSTTASPPRPLPGNIVLPAAANRAPLVAAAIPIVSQNVSAPPAPLRSVVSAAAVNAVKSEPPKPEKKEPWEELLADAHSHADAGRHEQAAACCRSAIGLNTLAFEPYFLLAQITEELGDRSGAKELLTKVIFLAPQFAPAYLHLSAIHDSENQPQKAKTLRNTAQDILATLNENSGNAASGGGASRGSRR